MAARITCAPKRYLLQFAHEHLDFRLQEVKSVISMLGCGALLKEKEVDNGSPFLEIELPSEKEAKAVMQRTVLGKRLYELWAEGTTVSEVVSKLQKLPDGFIKPYTDENSSFRIVVETFNKKISSADKVRRIEQLLTESTCILKGKINLSVPDNSFHLLEFYKFDSITSPNEPQKVYFGRWVSDGQRDWIREYHLQNRHFIANTSMDACLSMVMANLAQVKENDFVIDPFVGSGSLLVSSAHFGAYVIGTDIDYLLLHAKARPSRAKQKTRSEDESVQSNLRQYGLENKYIDVLVADASLQKMWRDGWKFDAIITDPPYGIRESASKIVRRDLQEEAEDYGAAHYPQKTNYQLGDIFKDLLNFAAKFLCIGGRLVYWLPIYRPDYCESNIPQHPCLEVRFNCEQPLSTTISRRLITMVKVCEHQEVSEPQGASIEVDHYEMLTFRQKYFKATSAAVNNSLQVKVQKT
ncbi:unnamed protein product [Candidula unifasciata]|uniref:tRNA (guanine(10)-N(2))-methyltransferase TRMT11 n=1 Tax=Candidula unifasciata TaxID=100452 RepID=A0A8S3ZYP9_9EUPU|nr:unnamed protein product [Candidula unifasciata]